MKRILLVLLVVITTVSMYAKDVDQSKAKQVARNFAVQRDRRANQLQLDVVYSHPMPNTRDAAFYVVNLGETGFVIVAANDVAHPVIGYSFDRPWPTEGNIPPQITDYLDDLAGQIEAASSKEPDRATKAEWQELLSINPNNPPQPKGDKTQVGPLLTTTWDQGQYYNNMTPETGSGHAVTGCVATAMAQIINYHEYPASGRGTHSYQSNYGELSVNFAESNYDYVNMPDALTNESSDAQVNAVAKLMSDCGVAVNMGYTSGESGAYDQEARAALINFFKYSPNMSFAEKAFFTANEWNTMLQTELDANRPVYYSGKGTGGHAFVCDGYNTDGYYHFNFGWSGSGNTWYLIDAVEPMGMNFNSDQAAILGIVPDANGNVILGQMQGTSTFVVDEPLEFYHIMGHNAYDGRDYLNPCSNNVVFIPDDETNQLAISVVDFNNQTLEVYDGLNTNVLLRSLSGGGGSDLSSIVSTANALFVNYLGNLYYSGFGMIVYQEDGCMMASNVSVSVDNDNIVHLTWAENENVIRWQIEYGYSGFVQGEGTMLNAFTNTIELGVLEKYKQYDFYIRTECSGTEYSPWFKKTATIYPPYWTDIVTSQPDGYIIDEFGNVEISSAEGFAWFASVANGLNGMPHDEVQWNGKVVKLVNDIDLSAYRWMPIKYGFCGGVLDGLGHTISGLFVKESGDAGLFSKLWCDETKIINLNIDNCYIYSDYRAGGIAADFFFVSLYNCYINGTVFGRGTAGGVAAFAADCEIINCAVRGDVRSLYSDNADRGAGGLVGFLRGVNINQKPTVVKNCYTMSSVVSPLTFKGVLAGRTENARVTNCYGLASEDNDLVGYQELSTIFNNEVIRQYGNSWYLNDSVDFDGIKTLNLLEALNYGVESINEHGLRTWIEDVSNNNIPIFGDTLEVVCENVSNVVARNIVVNGTQAIEVSWTENGEASEWEIKYGIQSNPHSELCDSLYYIITRSNPDTIYDLSNHNEETCIINVRPVCDAAHHGGWSRNCLLNINLPYWTDVVLTQPDGYIVDSEGNVAISTAEGLAWLESVVNGKNGQQSDVMSGRIITLLNDVDMSLYRWEPLGVYGGFINTGAVGSFEGVFDGAGHVISGLRINENADEYVGLFALLNNSTIKDLVIDNSYITGRSYVGGLFGFAEQSNIINCNVKAIIHGTHNIGGVGGSIRIASTIDHCSFEGEVYAEQGVCGGIIGSVNNNMSIAGILGEGVCVKNSWSSGTVVSNGDCSGGLAGAGLHHCSFYNSFSICDIVSAGDETGGLIGECSGPEFGYSPSLSNCYYSGNITGNTYVGGLIGMSLYRLKMKNSYAIDNGISLIGCWYGLNENILVSDAVRFDVIGEIVQLQESVSFGGNETNNLQDALNYWVQNSNDEDYYIWDDYGVDTIPFPKLSTPLEVTCQFPQVIVDTVWESGVRLKMRSNEDVQSFEVEYGPMCFEQGSGVIVVVSDTVLTITGLSVGEQYDFYVRSNCGGCNSKWIKKTIKPDKLYWKDVVTSQPEGWNQDTNGNIYISSPEALAWLITFSEQHLWEEFTIHIMNDLDIGRYKWTTFGRYYLHWNFEGHGHTISGLYIDEKQHEVAFIHTLYGGYIKDLFFDNSFVKGLAYVSTICHNNGGDIINCGVRGSVVGSESLGGVMSINSYSANVSNTYANCNIVVRSMGSSFGGFCGFNYGNLNNCYSASTLTIDTLYFRKCQVLGIFTGQDYSNTPSDNIAYWRNDVNNNYSSPVYGVGTYSDGYYAFSEEGSSLVVANPPQIGTSTYNNLLSSLNAWVDANNANGEYLHWVDDTENQNGGFPMLEATPATAYQIQPLVQGWNWWSTYIVQEGTNGMLQLKSTLGENGIQIKSQTSSTQHLPNGSWFGTLTTLENEKSYRVNVSGGVTTELSGTPVDPTEHPITLQPNWTWIGYPMNSTQSVTSAMSGFTPQTGDVIKSQGSSSFYTGAGWFPAMNMVPGQGYLYKSSATENRTLTFTQGRGEVQNKDEYQRHWDNDIHAFADNMTVLAVVRENGEELVGNGYELGAFVNGESRGSVRLEYCEPLDRYVAVLTVSGEDGDRITFGLFDRATEKESYDSPNAITFSSNAVLGELNKPYEIGFGSEGTTGLSLFPNPVGKNEEIRLELPSDVKVVEVVVTDMLGRVIRQETIQANRIAGMSESGVYNVQVITDKGKYHGKLIVK